jgi:ubiquinone biosynthesis protein Coq4
MDVMQLKLHERLQNLKMVAALASFLKTPGSLNSVFAVADSVKDGPLGEQARRHLLSDRHFKALVDEGWRPEPIDLLRLQALPEGSLGRCYADQLISQNITPEALIDPTEITNANEFVVHRVRETHDIVHVLTGFGLDGDSEIGLQGFNLAQNRSPVAVMLIFGAMLSSLQNDEPLEPLLRALAHGFQMGLDAELVIGRKLEEGWERPLKDWRKELKLPIEAED